MPGYVQPESVTAPQDSWKLDRVIYAGEADGIAVALGVWEGHQVVGLRWNGISEYERPKGNPTSSGHPTWFVLPHEFSIAIVRTLAEKYAAGMSGVDADALERAAAWLADEGDLPRAIRQYGKEAPSGTTS